MSSSATPALDLVRRAGIEHRVHPYTPAARRGRDRDARPDYGLEAAVALGVEPARMFKTLIVSVDGRLAAAVVPVDRQLDPRRVATALGGKSVVLAEPSVAERAAGSVVGGISPLALRRPLPIVVDASATSFPTIYISAGRRGLQLELAPTDLVRLGTGIFAAIGR